MIINYNIIFTPTTAPFNLNFTYQLHSHWSTLYPRLPSFIHSKAMSDTAQDPKVLDASLRVILGCINFLSVLILYFFTVLLSYFLLLVIASMLNGQLSDLFSQPSKTVKAASDPQHWRFAGAIVLATLLNAIVFFFVIAFNMDEHKYFWETFWHAFPVGLVVLGFSLVVQSTLMGLYACCASGSPTVEGVEMEPLADVEAQQDEASFENKA